MQLFRNLDPLSGSTTVSLVSSSLLSTCWWSEATNLSNVPLTLAVVTDNVPETAVCCNMCGTTITIASLA